MRTDGGSRAGTSARRSSCRSRSTSRITRTSCSARTAPPEPLGRRAGLRLDDDHPARGGAAVVRRRVQAAQDLYRQNVGGGHLFEHPEVVDADVVDDQARLIVEVDTRSPAAVDLRRPPPALPELHDRHREPERVPRGARAGLGDLVFGDEIAVRRGGGPPGGGGWAPARGRGERWGGERGGFRGGAE